MNTPGSPLVIWGFWTVALAWLAVLAVGVHDLSRIRVERRTALWGAAIGAVALFVRLWAPANQFELNDRLAMGHLRPDGMWVEYGLGVPTLARLVFWTVSSEDSAVFHLFAVLGALTLVPLVAVLREMGASWRTCGWAAVWLGLSAPHLRFSHTDLQAIPEGLLFLWGWWAAMRGRWAVAGLTLAVVSHMRPESTVLVVAVATWLVMAPPKNLEGLGQGLGIYAVIAWPQWVLALDKLFNGVDTPVSSWDPVDYLRLTPRDFLFMDPYYTAPVGIVVMVLGLVKAEELRTSTRVWLAAWALVLGGMIVEWSPAGGAWVFARHQIRSLPFVAMLFGAGAVVAIDWARERARWASHAVAAALLVVHAAWVPVGWTVLAHNAEYRFFSQQHALLPHSCVMVTYRPPTDLALSTPDHLSTGRKRDHQWLELHDPLPAAACTIYYRPANCYTFDDAPPPAGPQGRAAMTAACADFEASHDLSPMAVTAVPRGSMGLARFAPGRLEVGFYRVR